MTSFLRVKQILRMITATVLLSYMLSWLAYKLLISFTSTGFRLLYITAGSSNN